MAQSNFSVRNRLLIWRYQYSDTVIGVAFFCALALIGAVAAVRLQDNPVVATQRVMGLVADVSPAPVQPKAAVGRGIYYVYDIRLQDDGAVVPIEGDVGSPHPVGSLVPIERQHHKRGANTYRFLDG